LTNATLNWQSFTLTAATIAQSTQWFAVLTSEAKRLSKQSEPRYNKLNAPQGANLKGDKMDNMISGLLVTLLLALAAAVVVVRVETLI